jgi:hypothetical protein
VQITIALRDDHPCFLEQPEWQDIILTPPSDTIIADEWVDSYQVLPLMCILPRLLHACRDVVNDKVSQTSEKIESLVASASYYRKSLMELAEKHGWKPGLYSPLLGPRQPLGGWRTFCDREDMRAENFGNYLSALAVVNRILFAVRPSSEHLEAEARSSAMEIQYLHSFIKSEPSLQSAILIHSERVALAVLTTSNYWMASRNASNGTAFDPKIPGGGNIIESEKFGLFDDILTARAIDAPLM